jgi:hypothetical protein
LQALARGRKGKNWAERLKLPGERPTIFLGAGGGT